MCAIHRLLALVGQPGTHDPDDAFLWFRIDDDHESAIDRPDADEPVLEVRMVRVEELQDRVFGSEQALASAKDRTCFL